MFLVYSWYIPGTGAKNSAGVRLRSPSHPCANRSRGGVVFLVYSWYIPGTGASRARPIGLVYTVLGFVQKRKTRKGKGRTLSRSVRHAPVAGSVTSSHMLRVNSAPGGCCT